MRHHLTCALRDETTVIPFHDDTRTVAESVVSQLRGRYGMQYHGVCVSLYRAASVRQ